MSLINDQLDLHRTGGIGVNDLARIPRCLSGIDDLQSLSNGEILLYLYFKDSIDLTGIQVQTDVPITIGLYKYQTNLDFSDLGHPDISLRAQPNQRVKCNLTNCDYMSVHFKSRNDYLRIRSISLYGNKNTTHTRELEEIKITWSGGCFEEVRSVAASASSRYSVKMC